MSVALLLITHDTIGHSLLETATNMLGICPLATEILSIKRHSNPEQLFLKAEKIEIKNHLKQKLIPSDLYKASDNYWNKFSKK